MSNELLLGQVTAGADYALSKRTDVYLLAVEQRATGAGAVATITTIANSSSRNQNQARLGIRHIF
ncbi:hypothetical protein [uncultured Caballeronia sp.]|uniref:hypothetical protein n=1 Tax=uncultured Caballeronia sp. TaxID=1827198 RepID=UPI0035C9FD29